MSNNNDEVIKIRKELEDLRANETSETTIDKITSILNSPLFKITSSKMSEPSTTQNTFDPPRPSSNNNNKIITIKKRWVPTLKDQLEYPSPPPTPSPPRHLPPPSPPHIQTFFGFQLLPPEPGTSAYNYLSLLNAPEPQTEEEEQQQEKALEGARIQCAKEQCRIKPYFICRDCDNGQDCYRCQYCDNIKKTVIDSATISEQKYNVRLMMKNERKQRAILNTPLPTHLPPKLNHKNNLQDKFFKVTYTLLDTDLLPDRSNLASLKQILINNFFKLRSIGNLQVIGWMYTTELTQKGTPHLHGMIRYKVTRADRVYKVNNGEGYTKVLNKNTVPNTPPPHDKRFEEVELLEKPEEVINWISYITKDEPGKDPIVEHGDIRIYSN